MTNKRILTGIKRANTGGKIANDPSSDDELEYPGLGLWTASGSAAVVSVKDCVDLRDDDLSRDEETSELNGE